MTWTNWTTRRCSGGSVFALTALLLAGTGCGALEVSDPTAVEDEELNNATGARLLRDDALAQFYVAFGNNALRTGLLTDELTRIPYGSIPPAAVGEDQRELPPTELAFQFPYQQWTQIRRAATVAMDKLQRYGTLADAAEMLVLRGQVTRRLAEDFCPGFPSTELIDGQVIAGPPLTTEQALERAIADFDTAITLAADSARVLHFAQVGRAAALLGLGRFAEAALAAADVPTDYTWEAKYASSGLWSNPLVLFRSPFGVSPYTTMVDREGGNGLDFLSAGDPRAEARPNGTTDDGVTPVYNPAKYTDGSPIVVASGIEARLIEAEAALATGGDWLGILNNLRATAIVPALDPLDDPGTDVARVDLLFRERAFWLFATGHRLADLRRLMRLYGRDAQSLFPTGPYFGSGAYGTATSLPFDVEGEAEFNPAVTGCTGP